MPHPPIYLEVKIMAVKYVGQGAAIAGIPGRDLSDQDIEKYVLPYLADSKITESPGVWLESTGLYMELASSKQDKKAGE